MPMARVPTSFIFVVLTLCPAFADITGKARVIAGDTIGIAVDGAGGGTVVRASKMPNWGRKVRSSPPSFIGHNLDRFFRMKG